MAHDLLITLIEDHIKRGEELPRPGKVRGRNHRFIRLSALHAMKVELYQAFMDSGVRKSELARRRGIPKTVIDRLLDLGKNMRLDQIEAAFEALVKQVDVHIREAA